MSDLFGEGGGGLDAARGGRGGWKVGWYSINVHQTPRIILKSESAGECMCGWRGEGREMAGGEDFKPNDQRQSEHSVQFDNKLFILSDGLTETQI